MATQTSDIYTPYFRGKQTLIRFTDDPNKEIYLIDSDTKNIIPFVDDSAFFNYYGILPTDPSVRVTEIDSKEVTSGVFNGYKTLPNSEGVQIDGKMPKVKDYSVTNLYYGKEFDDNKNKAGFTAVTGFLKTLKTLPNSGIDENTISKALTDNNQLAFYVNAVAYGGYSLDDIYRDLKKTTLITQGRGNEFSNINPISGSKLASDYQQTQEGKMAKSNSSLNMPALLSGVDSSMFNLPIFNLPDEAFNAIVPPIDVNSPEFKAEMDNVKAAYYDVLMKSVEADTDHAKAVADYSWQQLKQQIEKKYNVQLSNNALGAWDQISSLESSFEQRGLSGSGLEQGAIQDYLKRVRNSDNLIREGKATEEQANKIDYLSRYGTDQQINDYISEIQADDSKTQEEKDALIKIFKPDENQWTIESLKKEFPDLSDDAIKKISESALSPTGNFRSDLYQKQIEKNVFDIQDPTSSLQAQKESYQATEVLQKKIDEEEKAYRELTTNQESVGSGAHSDNTNDSSSSDNTNDSGYKSDFRPRGTGEDLGVYIKLKNAYDAEKQGIPQNVQPQVPVTPPAQQSNEDARKQLEEEAKRLAQTGSALPTTQQQQPQLSQQQVAEKTASAPSGWTVDPLTGKLKKL